MPGESTEEVREQRAREHRTFEEQLARDRLYEANCRKVGGKPVTIQTNEGPELVCRSQTGGIVEVLVSADLLRDPSGYRTRSSWWPEA